MKWGRHRVAVGEPAAVSCEHWEFLSSSPSSDLCPLGVMLSPHEVSVTAPRDCHTSQRRGRRFRSLPPSPPSPPPAPPLILLHPQPQTPRINEAVSPDSPHQRGPSLLSNSPSQLDLAFVICYLDQWPPLLTSLHQFSSGW